MPRFRPEIIDDQPLTRPVCFTYLQVCIILAMKLMTSRTPSSHHLCMDICNSGYLFDGIAAVDQSPQYHAALQRPLLDTPSTVGHNIPFPAINETSQAPSPAVFDANYWSIAEPLGTFPGLVVNEMLMSLLILFLNFMLNFQAI